MSSTIGSSSTVITGSTVNSTSGYQINGVGVGYGMFAVSGNSYANTAYLTMSQVFANNTSVSTQILTLGNTGVWRIDLLLNYNTTSNGTLTVTMYTASTSGGTYSAGLQHTNYYASTTTQTTGYYSFLYQAGNQYIKFMINTDGSAITFDNQGPDYWSRVQVSQVA